MYGWLLSRKATASQKIEDLQNFDTSLQDLNQVAVHFTSSAGFRELLTGLKPYGMWSQSSRNYSIQDIPMNAHLMSQLSGTNAAHQQRILDAFQLAYDKSAEKDQDYGRMFLPLAHMCEYVFMAPVRLFLALWKSLELLCPDYNTLYLDPLFQQLGIDPYTRKYYPVHYEYSIPLSTQPSDGLSIYEFTPGTVEKDGALIISKILPIGLRAQLVRQSRVILRDNLFWLLADLGYEGFELLNLQHELMTVAQMSSHNYQRLCSKRACYIAQVDLWYDYLKHGYETIGFPQILPCKGLASQCTVPQEAEDAAIRNGATPPCPIFENDYHFFEIRKKAARYPEVYDMVDSFMSISFPNLHGALERLKK